MTFLQVVSFMTMQYVYFVNFRVKLGVVYRHKSSHCWELTLSNVSFCSLSVRNDQKTLFCLRELQVLLLNKLNFTHSRTHTIQRTVCLFMKKSFALKTAMLFCLRHFRKSQITYLDLHFINLVPRVAWHLK